MEIIIFAYILILFYMFYKVLVWGFYLGLAWLLFSLAKWLLFQKEEILYEGMHWRFWNNPETHQFISSEVYTLQTKKKFGRIEHIEWVKDEVGSYKFVKFKGKEEWFIFDQNEQEWKPAPFTVEWNN